MTQREIQENLIRTVRDMLLTSCEKMGAQSIEHCWTRHDGTEVKLILAIHPAGEKEEKPEDELYTYARAAVQKFGMNKQVDMAIEEMSELTKALLKYRRASDCATTVKSGDNIREEMEDVRIMLAQLDCIYGRSPQWAEKKLAHLKELVKGEGGAASAVEGLGVAAAHATGDKCERCWIYSDTVGECDEHPTLCERCAHTVGEEH